MRFRTKRLALRGALALCGALFLAACDSGQATAPEAVVGSWTAVRQQESGSSVQTQHWVDLRADGTYGWSFHVTDAARPPQDALLQTFEHSGSWKIQGGRLGLLTMTGMGWRRGTGGYQADFVVEWTYQHRIEVEGDRMELHYITRPEQSILPYTLVFERVDDTGPFPMGHTR